MPVVAGQCGVIVRMSLATAVAVAAVALLTALISTHSVFVLLWWALLAALAHRFLLGQRDVGPGLQVFAFYAFIAIALYLSQLWTNPQFYGFSGDGMLNSVGTDDSFFYSLVGYDLPFDFPRRFAIETQHHQYAAVLAVLVSVHRRIFPGLHPLDLLFFNTFCLSFLPFFARLVYRSLFPGDRGDRWAFSLTLLAPFVLANGAILMRDGLVAVAFIGGIAAAQRQRWLGLFLCLLAALWLRLESGIMLAGIVWVLILTYRHLDEQHASLAHPGSGVRWAVEAIGSLVFVLVVAQVVFHLAWWDMVFRSDFLRSSVGASAARESGTATFYELSRLPWPLRIPLTAVFYIGSPFLALTSLRAKGLWVPRAFLNNTYAFLFPLYAAWFYRGFMRATRSRHSGSLVFFLLFVANIALVTQASMQLRHKIPLQGMFYVLVAYGAMTPYDRDRSVGWLLALTVVLLDVVFNFLQLSGG